KAIHSPLDYRGENDVGRDWALVHLETEATGDRLSLAALPDVGMSDLPSKFRIESGQLDGSYETNTINGSNGSFDPLSGGIDTPALSFRTFYSGSGALVPGTEGGDSGGGWYSDQLSSSQWDTEVDLLSVLSGGRTVVVNASA